MKSQKLAALSLLVLFGCAQVEPALVPTPADESVASVDIPDCVRLAFVGESSPEDQKVIATGFQRVCDALLRATCPALEMQLEAVNGRTGYSAGWFNPERMKGSDIVQRLKRHMTSRPLIKVSVKPGGGIASTGFESPSMSSLRFDPEYFRSPTANRGIFHTAIHETLHMLACEAGDPCTAGSGPRFLDTGFVSFLTRNTEFATYQIGHAFETALTDASCAAP